MGSDRRVQRAGSPTAETFPVRAVIDDSEVGTDSSTGSFLDREFPRPGVSSTGSFLDLDPTHPFRAQCRLYDVDDPSCRGHGRSSVRLRPAPSGSVRLRPASSSSRRSPNSASSSRRTTLRRSTRSIWRFRRSTSSSLAAHRRVVTSSRHPRTSGIIIVLSIQFMRVIERVQRMKTQSRQRREGSARCREGRRPGRRACGCLDTCCRELRFRKLRVIYAQQDS